MALIIALGDPVIINVLVLSPGILIIPTGTVILQDSTHTVSVGRLGDNGQFTFNISSTTLGLGTHEMKVYYAGDQNFAPGFSNVLEVDIVNLTPSVTTITPSATSITYGMAVTFSSTVTGSGGTPTGTVTFLDGTNVIDTETLVSGSATSIAVVLSGGMHAVIAEYSGDNIFGGSSSFPALLTVSEYASSIAVFSSSNPSNYGGNVIFTASITVPVGGVAIGTITFYDGATVIGTSGVSANSGSLMVSTLTAGNHNITAQYSGDSNFSSSTSPILVQVVNQLPSMTTLMTSANPITWGTAVLLTATVSSAFTIPTGTVTFYDGVTALSSAIPVNNSGVATLNIPLFSVALSPHSLTAQYSGDTNYLVSTSNSVSEVVNKQNTTTTVVSSAPTSPAGVNITFTATIVGSNNGPVSGTVQFYNNASPMGSPATVNGSGMATYSTSILGTGSYTITATYSGDSNNNTSTSAPITQVITAEASSTFLISNMPTVNYGTSGVIFTATVSGSLGTPTGTVQFQDNGVNLGSVQGLVGGVATFSLSPTQLLPGTHPITAIYSGDSTYAPDTSNTVFQVINRLTPTFTVSSSANPSIYGNSVIFFGTAVGTQGTPTGTVQFVIDGTNFGAPITLVAGSAQTSTSALLATPTLSPAYHTISANYNGDMIYNSASISLSPNQTVSKANVSVSINSSIPTTAINQSTTFSSTVTSVTTGTPTGTVQFKNGGVNINGAIPLISGTGSLAYSGLTIGAHTITSTYSGDANFNGNTSINFTQTVTASPTTTTLLSNLPTSTYGQAVIFTATVNGSSPTGTLTFKNGGVTFATTTLPTNTTSYALLTAGSHSITVVYSGDGNNGPSTSNTVTQMVNKASTTINPFTASPSSGETVFSTFSLSATVNPQYVVSPGPSGSITFTIVSPFTSLGSGVISANVATLGSLNIPTAGTYQLQANYVGDSNFNGSSQFIGGFVVSKLTPSISQNFINSTTAGNPSTTDYVDLIGDGSHNVTGTVTLLIDGVTTALTGNLIHRGGIDTTYPGIAISGTNFGGTEQQGYHTVQASYGGSSSYNAVTSTVTSYFYQCATPTITITITGSPSYYPAPPPSTDITITITVSGSFGLPTGNVSLNVVGELTGHAFNTGPLTLSAGTATVLISNTFGTPTPGYSPISTGIYNDLVGPPASGTQTYSTSTLYSGDNTYIPGGNTGPTFEIYGPEID
jgi:hypothetical protein